MDGKGRWTGMTGMIQEQEGIVSNMAAKLYTQQYVQTPSMVVKRGVYESIGAFDRRLNCMEDWEMWIRIANTYPIVASQEVLALYRGYVGNATSLTFKDGSALKTHQLICDLVDDYIQPEIKKKFYKLRKIKQSEFLLLSLRSIKNQLGISDRIRYANRILKLDFGLKIILQLAREFFI